MIRNQLAIRIISQLLIFCLLNLTFSGCYYYKARTKPLNHPQGKVGQLIPYSMDIGRHYYFLVHYGDKMYEFFDPYLDGNNGIMRGQFMQVDQVVGYYHQKIDGKVTTKARWRDRSRTRQIHVYINEYQQDEEFVVIRSEDIGAIEIYDPNFGLIVVSILGTTTIAYFSAIILFLLIFCNCPHAYVFDGNEYHYDASMFTGAIAPALERHDFKIVPDYQPDESTYRMKIKNEEDETQFTDLLELKVVSHGKGVMAAFDQNGKVHAFSNMIEPSNLNNEIKWQLSESDEDYFQFNEINQDGFSYLNLQFDMPEKTDSANLLLVLKNTSWGAFAYNQMTQLFGESYQSWVSKHRDQSKEDLMKWPIKQGVLLGVEVKTKSGWNVVEYVDLVGNVRSNRVAIPLNGLNSMDGNIEVRLKSGYRLWEIDQVGISYDQSSNVEVQTIAPLLTHESQSLVQLNNDDGDYLVQEQGDSLDIVFNGLRSDALRTIFLHSKGHYITNRNYTGKPKKMKLVRFSKKGEFSKFSESLHRELMSKMTIVEMDE
ncbi:MAG: hypothetical protein JXQ90_22585 [Cyclobacteriaceae bacterium]